MQVEDYGWAAHAPGSANYLNPVVRKLALKSGGKTVLDAGCGNGELAGFLAKAGFDVTGVDADRRGIEIATARFPDCRFIAGSFSDAPPGRFDIAVSTEVVEHLYSPHKLGQYCYAALRPGGALIITTPYHGYLKNLALALAGRWGRHLAPNWHGGHIKFWDRASLEKMLREAGFVVTSFHGVGRIPFLWKSMVIVAVRPVRANHSSPQ